MLTNVEGISFQSVKMTNVAWRALVLRLTAFPSMIAACLRMMIALGSVIERKRKKKRVRQMCNLGSVRLWLGAGNRVINSLPPFYGFESDTWLAVQTTRDIRVLRSG